MLRKYFLLAVIHAFTGSRIPIVHKFPDIQTTRDDKTAEYEAVELVWDSYSGEGPDCYEDSQWDTQKMMLIQEALGGVKRDLERIKKEGKKGSLKKRGGRVLEKQVKEFSEKYPDAGTTDLTNFINAKYGGEYHNTSVSSVSRRLKQNKLSSEGR